MSIDLPGFADPVAGAQATFRALLDALSRPGAISKIGRALTPPSGMDAATGAALLTLAGAETPLWIDPAFSRSRDWIAFHCGSPIVDDVSAADFVVTTTLPDLWALNAGSDDAPETSATVILQMCEFRAGISLVLTGPGIETAASLSVSGLPSDFVARWATNRRNFPRGIDLVLCAGDEIAALPRTVSIREA